MAQFEIFPDEAVSTILSKVTLESGYDKSAFGLAYVNEKSLGMLAFEAEGQAILAGWCVPQSGELTAAASSITELTMLPRDQRRADIVGKGVGPRLYNSPEAELGSSLPGRAALYAVAVDPEKILDFRRSTEQSVSGKLLRIAEHAGKVIAAKTMPNGLGRVVDRVHASYGDAETVVWAQPPRAQLRQNHRGGRATPLPPAFALIRAEKDLFRISVVKGSTLTD